MSNLDFGWSQKELSQLVVFSKGKKVDTNKEVLPNYLRYLGASGIEGKNDGFGNPVGGVIANENDILMLWDGERSGLVGIGQTGVVASTVSRLRVNLELLDPKFLYYLFQLKFNYIQQQRTGTGVPHVPKDLKTIFLVKYPDDIKQQQKIAKILSTVDNVIEQTQALIDKYTVIKKGMMADLFTRGIDLSGTPKSNPNHGQLRPSFEEAPELYKETELGWLPQEWKVRSLESLLADSVAPMRSGPFGSALLKNELTESGIPLLGIDNIFIERFKSQFRRFVPEHKYRELIRYSVKPKDVIITIMGTVGRCCVVPDDFKQGLSSKHLWTMTLDQKRVIAELVCWQLNYSPFVKSWFHKKSQGGVMEAIQSSTLKGLQLPLPLIAEQQAIFKIYNSLSEKINTEKDLLRKLDVQKKGLMQDLLTGKVRVNA